MANKLQLISELAGQTAHAITHSAGGRKQDLNIADKRYRYPFTDQLLICAQRPGAAACTSPEGQYGRTGAGTQQQPSRHKFPAAGIC